MKIDLQAFTETAKNEILKLAEEAINSTDGVFSYDSKDYIAVRKAQNGSIEIHPISLLKYKMTALSPQKKDEFRNKVQLAKQSSNVSDRKFKIEDIMVEVKETDSGNFAIHTFIVDPNTIQVI